VGDDFCARCGELATRNQRLVNGRPAPYAAHTIMVSGTESYEARCRRCHEVPRVDEDQGKLL
jgi:thymidine kinase